MPQATTIPSINKCPQCGSAVPAIQELQEQLRELKRQVSDLTHQVLTDNLTGLYNHRHFSQALDKELERTHRTGQATALIMVDLDHFKKVNDTYGHEAGNQVLITTARLLQQAIRKLDIPCRYGGEEFAIILPSTDLLTSSQVAERLRALVENTVFAVATDADIRLTTSVGVDVYTNNHQETAEEFIQRVDALLYQAKRGGRNRVCHGVRDDLRHSVHVSTDEKDALQGLFGGSDDD